MSEFPRARTFAAMLLTAGTCIGGGMLALPVATGALGWMPSLVIMAVACIFMATTGILFVEANLWFEEGAHLFTITRKLLGPLGRIITIVLYCFVGYASLVAYTDGIADLLRLRLGLDQWGLGLLIVVVLGGVVLLGKRVIGPVNAALFGGLVIAYLLLTAGGADQVQFSLLRHVNWSYTLWTLPLMLAVFSYQVIVPSLVAYLHRDVQRLKIAIIGGIIIAFFIFAIWQTVVLGIVPFNGDGVDQSELITHPLRRFSAGQWLAVAAEFFAFFALVTSFLGFGMGLFDFFADGLRVPRRWWGHLCLGGLVLVPTYICAGAFPNIFATALAVSGGFGDAILNGLIPVLLVWSGRYIQRQEGGFHIPGGVFVLVVVALFALLVFGTEVYHLVNYVSPAVE